MLIDRGNRRKQDAARSGKMQGYWKKDVTGAMILLERETPRLFARATFLAKALRFLSMTYVSLFCSFVFP